MMILQISTCRNVLERFANRSGSMLHANAMLKLPQERYKFNNSTSGDDLEHHDCNIIIRLNRDHELINFLFNLHFAALDCPRPLNDFPSRCGRLCAMASNSFYRWSTPTALQGMMIIEIAHIYYTKAHCFFSWWEWFMMFGWCEKKKTYIWLSLCMVTKTVYGDKLRA